MEPDLDALGLLAVRRRISLRFGASEAGPTLTRANMSSAMNKMPDAQVVIDLARATSPIDYFAGLAIGASEGGRDFPRFVGSIVSADPIGEEVAIKALGAAAFTEQQIMGMAVRGVPPFELVHVLARSAGLREEQLNIEGLDKLPRETFEVVAPIDGAIVEQPTSFAGVRFLPGEFGARAIAGLAVGDELGEAYQAPTYALALVTATRCFDGEERGLAAIDLALAWLTVRLRYGLAVLPDGQPLRFARSEALAAPSRRDVVFLRGLATTRQWLRRPRTAPAPRCVELITTEPRLASTLPTLSLQEELAILSLARATREPDLLARVQALFEAIEFYVANVRIADLFSKSERKEVRRGLPASLTAEQSRRLDQLLGDLNNAPLRARLMQALDDDAVPVAAAEVELLWRLRALRNDVVHGRRSELPIAEDVEYAISIVARMLVHRVDRLQRRG